MPDPAIGKKTDPRVDRTRKLIAEAFLDVMNEKGFEDLTVNDITEKAGINRVTFYAHFADKYVLLSDEVRRRFAELLKSRGLGERGYGAAAVRELFQATCDYVSATYRHCKPPLTHLDWVMKDQVTSLSSELLIEWAGGQGDGDAMQLAATAASSALYGLVVRWIRLGDGQSAEDFVEASLPLVTGILGLS